MNNMKQYVKTFESFLFEAKSEKERNMQTVGTGKYKIVFDSNEAISRESYNGEKYLVVRDINTKKDYGVVRKSDGSYEFRKDSAGKIIKDAELTIDELLGNKQGTAGLYKDANNKYKPWSNATASLTDTFVPYNFTESSMATHFFRDVIIYNMFKSPENFIEVLESKKLSEYLGKYLGYDSGWNFIGTNIATFLLNCIIPEYKDKIKEIENYRQTYTTEVESGSSSYATRFHGNISVTRYTKVYKTYKAIIVRYVDEQEDGSTMDYFGLPTSDGNPDQTLDWTARNPLNWTIKETGKTLIEKVFGLNPKKEEDKKKIYNMIKKNFDSVLKQPNYYTPLEMAEDAIEEFKKYESGIVKAVVSTFGKTLRNWGISVDSF